MEETPPAIPETPATEIPPAITPPPPRKFRTQPFFYLLILAAFLPVATAAVLIRQSLTGEASSGLFCRTKPAIVRINPGQAQTSVTGPNVYLSALAYDKKDQPIWDGITYEWGMSSTASIGNLIPQNQIAAFIPQNPGRGDIFVTATACKNQKANGSAAVTVLPATLIAPSPTESPLPSVFPVITATPTLPPPVLLPTAGPTLLPP
jgi:hypothetical protein